MPRVSRCKFIDPATGMPFSGNMVPVNAQAKALLLLYPMPNTSSAAGYNYQAAVLSSTRNDSMQSRFSKTINNKNQVFGTLTFRAPRRTRQISSASRIRQTFPAST